MDIKGKKIIILGLGLSGYYAALLAKKYGASVAVSDSGSGEKIMERARELKKKGIQVETSCHSVKFCSNCDFCVVSPGIVLNEGIVACLEKKGIKVISEIDFAFRATDSKVIAITGTNGKSTTAELVLAMLLKSGINADAGGNLGKPFSQMVLENPGREVFVVEVSSFQLERCFDFNPYIAVILNIEPDHLDRYKNLKDYVSAKKKLFNIQRNGYRLFRGADEKKIGLSAKKGGAVCIRVGGDLTKGSIFVKNGLIQMRLRKKAKLLLNLSTSKLMGNHNTENLMFAAGISLLSGVSSAAITEAVKNFSGLHHRMELVGVVKDITYINDSKATNVDALKTALTAIDKNIILIAGGIWKKDSFRKIRNIVKKKVKMCFLIGKHANVIKAQLKGVCEIQKVAGLSSAVKEASKIAIQGDTVLLSPGCSSFDMFADYRERGEVFKAEVFKRKKGEKNEF